MVTARSKLLVGAAVAACAATAGTGNVGAQLPCIPGLPLLGCVPAEEPPPSTGPSDPGSEPQPPPQPPPPPPTACDVKRSKGKGTFTGLVAEQIYGTESTYRGCALSQAADAGVRIIRQPLRWAEIERSKGRFDFSWWDRYMEALARHRIQLMPILFHPPDWRARKGKVRGIYPPRRNSEFAAFAKRVARRYGPTGSFWKRHPNLPRMAIRSWQVWNEPNLRFYWPPEPNARAYTDLLAATKRGIEKVDPRAEIVTAGLPQSKIEGSVPQRSYARALYRAGAKRHFDTLAIHSYTESHRALLRQVRGIRAEMRRSRDGAKLWITEIGWATGGPDKRFTPGLRGQKRRINLLFQMAKAKRRALGLRGLVYYMWQDAPPYPGFRDFWGLHTGLLDKDGNEKPGMKPFRRHALDLRQSR